MPFSAPALCPTLTCAGPSLAHTVRAQRDAGGSTTVIGVWRYVLLSICNVALGAYYQGGFMPLLFNLRRGWWPIFGCSCIIVFINFGFCISLLKCDAALALLLISLNPLWAALLGKLCLGDPIPLRTAIAQALSLVAMLLVVLPALLALIAPTASEAEIAYLSLIHI